MKILILGASGNVGSAITNILKKKNIDHKTLGSKQNDINIDIKKDINSFIQIFRNHKYTHIINCLWIRNEQNLIGNYEHIHKLIISIKNELLNITLFSMTYRHTQQNITEHYIAYHHSTLFIVVSHALIRSTLI